MKQEHLKVSSSVNIGLSNNLEILFMSDSF